MERKVARKTEELNKQVRQLQSSLIGANGQCPRKLNSRSTKNDHYLRSCQSVSFKPSISRKLNGSPVTSQSRSLRSNNSPCSVLRKKSSACSTKLSPLSASSRRKKDVLDGNHISLENIKIQSPKSPRNIASSVVRASAINKRPIIHTRSRRARVLHLKK